MCLNRSVEPTFVESPSEYGLFFWPEYLLADFLRLWLVVRRRICLGKGLLFFSQRTLRSLVLQLRLLFFLSICSRLNISRARALANFVAAIPSFVMEDSLTVFNI